MLPRWEPSVSCGCPLPTTHQVQTEVANAGEMTPERNHTWEVSLDVLPGRWDQGPGVKAPVSHNLMGEEL